MSYGINNLRAYAFPYTQLVSLLAIRRRLKSLRIERGMTQTAVADGAGLAQSVISRLEDTDQESPETEFETIRKIVVDGFGVPLSLFFEDIERLEDAPKSTHTEQYRQAITAALAKRSAKPAGSLVAATAGHDRRRATAINRDVLKAQGVEPELIEAAVRLVRALAGRSVASTAPGPHKTQRKRS